MDDITTRLIACFETVFPAVPAEQIPSLSQANTSAWDSVAAITLVNVIEEEFVIEMDFDLLADLDSFSRVDAYLRGQPIGTPAE